MKEENSTFVSRRSFLTSGSALAASCFAIPAGASEQKEPLREVATLRRDYSNPVSIKRLINLRNRAISEWQQRTETKHHRYSLATPSELQSDFRLVAVNFYVTDQGVPVQFLGYANSAQAAIDAKEGANQKASQATFDSPIADSDVSTLSEDSWSSWTQLHWSQNHYYSNETTGEGVLTQEIDHRVDPDDGSSTYNYHAVKTGVDMESGKNHYGTEWKNHYGHAFHDWSTAHNDLNIDMQDRAPRGTTDGSVSKAVSLTTSSVGVEYTYSQPEVYVQDVSSMSINEGEFTMDVTGTGAQDTNAYMNPGSMAQLTPPGACSGSSFRVATIDVDCEFRRPRFGEDDYQAIDPPAVNLSIDC